MSGRARRYFWTEDVGGYWVQYWQQLGDPVEYEPEREDYTAELILAMSTLTGKQRFAVECRYGLRPDCEALSVSEIASLMGITKQAASRLIHRGMCSLRRGLTDLYMVEGAKTKTGEVRPNVLRMDQSRVLEEPTE